MTTTTHPLTAAGLTPGPEVSCWAVVRLPLAELAQGDSDVASRRHTRIASESAYWKLDAEHCGACGQSADTLYIVGDNAKRAALCEACIRRTGNRVLIQRMRSKAIGEEKCRAMVSPDRRH
jgi:hypothetical protein